MTSAQARSVANTWWSGAPPSAPDVPSTLIAPSRLEIMFRRTNVVSLAGGAYADARSTVSLASGRSRRIGECVAQSAEDARDLVSFRARECVAALVDDAASLGHRAEADNLETARDERFDRV